MAVFTASRDTQTATMNLNAPPALVFPLLCPVREYEWLPVWQCEMIYSVSGLAEDNCVFITEFPGDRGRETWSVSRYEPDKAIEFIRFTPDIKVTRLNIHLRSKDDRTIVTWTRTVTALSAEGNAVIENIGQDAYKTEVGMLEEMLNHYLKTGRMLEHTGYLSDA